MYVDDSGSRFLSEKEGPYYVLSGIIIHESRLKHVENKVREYKMYSFVGKYTNNEVHVYEIANKMGNFSCINDQTRILLLKNLYNTINLMPITIISVCIGKRMLPDYYPNWETIESAWTFIAERFDRFISENSVHTPNKGIVIADKSSRSMHQEVVEIINGLRQFGSNTHQ
jgi:hypothetical protein